MPEILPDPNNKVNTSGAPDQNGSPGPGFASATITSTQPIMKSRSNSGRVITSAKASQYWTIAIQYNPMPRDLFDILYSFLLRKRGGLIPFYVSLPQYTEPKDPLMLTNPVTTTLASPGENTLEYTVAAGAPSIGDLFVVEDPLDSTHTKAYIVTGVDAGPLLNCSPPLSKEVSVGSTLRFINPLIRVISNGDTQEYKIGDTALYSYSLNLEEVQS